MPKYDFKCRHCDLVFEAVRSFAEAAAPALCPHDGSPSDRQFTPPAQILVRGAFRDAVDRKAAAAARPTWSHDDVSCHTHEPVTSDSHGDQHGHAGPSGHDHEVGDHHGQGDGHHHGHAHGHGHTH